MTSVTIPTLEGDTHFTGYIARPQGPAKAAVIVIQEIFGVNPGIRQKCDKLAAEGMLFERRVFHSMFATEDQKEGMAAFLEKREAQFRDK